MECVCRQWGPYRIIDRNIPPPPGLSVCVYTLSGRIGLPNSTLCQHSTTYSIFLAVASFWGCHQWVNIGRRAANQSNETSTSRPNRFRYQLLLAWHTQHLTSRVSIERRGLSSLSGSTFFFPSGIAFELCWPYYMCGTISIE